MSDSFPAALNSVKPLAVIDVGSTAIRMAIAEVDASGRPRNLESLTQAVSLGRDTFTSGSIRRETTEDCVRVLRAYKKILNEYDISSPSQIRVVATSAVREASNRHLFLDRIYIATGLEIEAIDEAEANRVNYLGIQPFLSEPELAAARALVMEVSGGSTEVLLVRGGNVVFSNAYRLGSLRLRKMLEAFRAPVAKSRNIMEGKILRTIEQVREYIPADGSVELLALGGDMQFAATEILPEWNPSTMGRVPLEELERLTDRMLSLSEDDIVRRYHLSYPDAETVGPALLAYVMMAREFEVVNLLVINTNLRDGLLKEMTFREAWSEEFRQQIIRSALDLARKFDVDIEHARHVADLSQLLFQRLQSEHGLSARHSVILYVAALLHEVGLFISARSHHKHAMYLIRNSEIFGFGQRELLYTSLVARYQRRASPQPGHEGYADLTRDERVSVSKMAAILRIAIALSDSRSARVQDLQVKFGDGRMILNIPHVDDLSLEQLALQQSGTMIEEVFGCQVLLRAVS